MPWPRRITADALGGLLLISAAAVLLATPYDGGSCKNVAAAYALPAASLPEAHRPTAPAALADARRAVTSANAEMAALQGEQAAVEAARVAAQEARTAANEAQDDLWESSFTGGYFPDSSLAQYDVDSAESAVEYAEDWLAHVQENLTSEYAFYTQADVDEAQQDLDDARAELAEAEAALSRARSEEAARESEAADAEATAEELAAAADVAEAAAAEAASGLAARESAAQSRLSSARSRVAALEADHEATLAEWSHEQREAADEVTALNNVRDSCRENGVWRAGVALLDVALAAVLLLRRWRPGLPRHLRRPWRKR
ncbi:hypothetical protein [Blastococcus sp. SYSU DS0828]